MRAILLASMAVGMLAGCAAAGSPGTATSTAGSASGTGTASGSAGSTGASSSSTAGSTGGGSTGAAGQSGECDTDADCPGSTCVAVTPGGYRVCAVSPTPAVPCAGGSDPGQDQCCPSSDDCPNGEACVLGPVVPECAGLPTPRVNLCAADQCHGDADCDGGEICVPAGTLGRAVRACVPAACKVDVDCTASAGGACEPVDDNCCGQVIGLFCVYPSGGCRGRGDCGAGETCAQSGGVSACQPGGMACPG